MKIYYAVIILLLMSCMVFAQENVTNQTENETDDGSVDYVGEAQGILEGMYNNYKMMFQSFTKATGIEAEAVSAMLAVALILVLLGKRARKYLFYALILFAFFWIIGWI